MVSSATAYSVTMKVQDLHTSKSEGREKEGSNFSSFHELISEKARHIPHVLGIIMYVSLPRICSSRSLVAGV